MATRERVRAAPPKQDTPKEYWGEKRNERRRRRYEEDPQYRTAVRQRARRTQFAKRRDMGLDVREGENCRDNLTQLLGFEKRGVYLGDTEVTTARALTAEDLAGLLNRDPQVLYRWMGKKMLPRPVFEAINDRNRRQAVYTEEEARAIINVFGKHQEASLYFRTTHTETIRSIHQAVAAVRQKMGVIDDSHPQSAKKH